MAIEEGHGVGEAALSEEEESEIDGRLALGGVEFDSAAVASLRLLEVAGTAVEGGPVVPELAGFSGSDGGFEDLDIFGLGFLLGCLHGALSPSRF